MDTKLKKEFDSIKYANETLENIYSRIYELESAPYLGRFVPEKK